MGIQAIPLQPGPKALTSSAHAEEPTAEMRKTAAEFEAVFISEMLAHAGFESALTRDTGFAGEAMAGFMTAQIAQKLSARGDFGLAEIIARQLLRSSHEATDQ